MDVGIPVMGHIGMTPQSIHKFGRYHVQRDEEELVADQELQSIGKEILVALDDAVKFADESPWPEPEELFSDVYVSYN
ncbi:MAG: 3-methyl-2-oxobutanoate hydroxymethyltransferase [Chloroflexi bacterium]|nr:3-methyl-2-oxobutanoate hydroxymethyltransferase [Chloroflexota bacterium]